MGCLLFAGMYFFNFDLFGPLEEGVFSVGSGVSGD